MRQFKRFQALRMIHAASAFPTDTLAALLTVAPTAWPTIRRRASTSRVFTPPMLSFLNAAQLVLYIALLVMLGQGALYALVGEARHRNVLYGLLQVLSKPFVWPLNWLLCTALPARLPAAWRAPAQAVQRWVPMLSFVLVLLAYAVVTFERIDHCVSAQMLGQPGCR